MALTPKQLKDRQSRLGATDVSAILGINPWASAYEVWLEKRGKLGPSKGSRATTMGSRLESAILDEAEEQLGETLVRNLEVKAKDLPIVATLDSQGANSLKPVEAKSTGIVGPVYGEWGDANTDVVPESYLVQVQAQLLCTGQELAHLFALIGGRGIVQYDIARSDTVIDVIANRCSDWWDNHVVKGIEPPRDSVVPLEVIKRIKREPETVKEFTESDMILVEKWERTKRRARAIDKLKRERESQMLLQLGDCEGATLPDGRELVFLETKRSGFTTGPTTYRTARIRKGA